MTPGKLTREPKRKTAGISTVYIKALHILSQ